MKLYTMTMLSRALSLSALFAACVNMQPLHAQSVKQVTVTITQPVVALGGRTTAQARVRLANGTYATNKPIAWGTSKPGVALVSDKGVVSTVTAGSATIVATVSGVVGQAVLTVTPGVPPPPAPTPVASVAVSLSSTSIAAGGSTTATAVARDSSGDVLTNRAVVWSSVTPNVATVTGSGIVTGLVAGSATIRAAVETKSADASLTVTTPPPPPPPDTSAPTLPALLTTTVASTPSAGRTLAVASNGNLQAAIDSARPGDRIVVACGTYSGNFTLGAKSGGIAGGWITVQSAGTIPAEGTRTSPTAAPCFPKLATPGVPAVLTTTPTASRWRLIGLELTNDTTAAFNYGLVVLEGKNIILDRTYIHGTVNSNSRRCVALNSDSTAIIDSYVSECHSNGFDTQAIFGWNGNGPYKITNNYMEASTEVFGFGGADPAVQGLVPSDIELRGNHIARPMGWQPITAWLEKNLIELKNARRVLIDGNVIENAWPQAQYGWAFVLFSVNQNGGCSWCVVQDVTIRNNLIRNVAAGFSLSDMYHGVGSVDATPMHRLAITNNVIIGLDNPDVAGGGWGFQINREIASLRIDHNTFFLSPTASISSFMWGVPPGARAMVIRNNLTGGGRYPLFASPTNTWASMAGPGSDFAGNVVAYADGTSFVPASNAFPGSFAALGLAGGASVATSVTASLDSLALAPSSAYKNAATDSTDPGANIAVVKAAIANVIQGAEAARIAKP